MNFDTFVPATAVITLTGMESIPVVPAGGPTKQTSPNAILALGAQYQGGHALTLGGYVVANGGTNVISPAGDFLYDNGVLALPASGGQNTYDGTGVMNTEGDIYYATTGVQAIAAAGTLIDPTGNPIADVSHRYAGTVDHLDGSASPGTSGQVWTSQGAGTPPLWVVPALNNFQNTVSTDISITTTGVQIVETISSIGNAGQVWLFVGTVTGQTGLAAGISGYLEIADSAGTIWGRQHFQVPYSSSNNTFSETMSCLVAFTATVDMHLQINAVSVTGTTTVESTPPPTAGSTLYAVRIA